MIDYETYVQIRNYFTHDHLRYSQIANKLGLDQRTVAIWANEKKYRARNQHNVKVSLIPLKIISFKCWKNIRTQRNRFINGLKRMDLKGE